MGGRTGGRTDGRTDGRTGGRTDERTDGRTDLERDAVKTSEPESSIRLLPMSIRSKTALVSCLTKLDCIVTENIEPDETY